MKQQEFNIASNSENEIEVGLSNLSYYPFIFNGIKYASIESFWQSLKFKKGTKDWKECIKLYGKEAKIFGNKAKLKNKFIYNGVEYIVGSEEHQNLMKEALREQLKQNPEKLKLLLSTGDSNLIHRPIKKDGTYYPDSKTIPGNVFGIFLMELREEFSKILNQTLFISNVINDVLVDEE